MKKSLFFGMAALLVAGITSCSNDDLLTVDQSKPLEADTSFFANIAISNTDAMTRAGETSGDYEYDNEKDPEYEIGKDYENDVKTIYLIFYDIDGNRVSTTQVRKNIVDNFEDFSNSNNESTTGPGNYIYKGVVQIDVKHGSKVPAYVMCFINPITSTNFEINPDFETLDNMQEATRGRIIDDNGKFAMSKSVYYGNDRVSGEQNQKIVATPLVYKNDKGEYVEDRNLFDTEEEAKEALKNVLDGKNGVVDIYVERYAAKVDLTLAEPTGNNWIIKLYDDEAGETTGYTLEFTPEYWAVNAYEETNYICKSFKGADSEGHFSGKDLTYDELQLALFNNDPLGYWKWNSPENHRCFWAQSPAYYAAAYPRVADDILDNGVEQYALRYYSYEQMKKNAEKQRTDALDLISKARAFADNGVKYSAIYARENTVAGSALRDAYDDPNASPKAAIASAVIVGNYKLMNNGKEVTKDQNPNFNGTFYIAGNKVNGYHVYEDPIAMTDYFINTTVKFAKDENGEEPFFEYGTAGADGKFIEGNDDYRKYFVVTHPFEAARKGLVIDSRFVTIQLNPEIKFDDVALYAYLNDKYVQVTNENVDEVNKQMLYTAGTVQCFNNGLVFYNIPIKHLGFYRDNNPNAGMAGTEKTFNWKGVVSGDFGLVRNHSYSIHVNKIEGLGNGISNPNDPIVPPTDPEEYFIGARIVVLNWAVVPTQKVDL